MPANIHEYANRRRAGERRQRLQDILTLMRRYEITLDEIKEYETTKSQESTASDLVTKAKAGTNAPVRRRHSTLTHITNDWSMTNGKRGE